MMVQFFALTRTRFSSWLQNTHTKTHCLQETQYLANKYSHFESWPQNIHWQQLRKIWMLFKCTLDNIYLYGHFHFSSTLKYTIIVNWWLSLLRPSFCTITMQCRDMAETCFTIHKALYA